MPIKNIFRLSLAVVASAALSFQDLQGQTRFEVDPSSTFVVSGTSTLHDWACTSKEVKGFALLSKNWVDGKPGKEEAIVQAEIKVASRSLLSGRGSIMDDKTYNALKEYDHPEIAFKLVSGKMINSEGNKERVEIAGQLTLAGKTQNITLVLEGVRVDGNTFTFTGSKPLKMSDYEVEPPTAMFGTIVTDDLVTVTFNLTMIRK